MLVGPPWELLFLRFCGVLCLSSSMSAAVCLQTAEPYDGFGMTAPAARRHRERNYAAWRGHGHGHVDGNRACNTGVCVKHTPFTGAFLLQSGSRNCSPAPSLVCLKLRNLPTCPILRRSVCSQTPVVPLMVIVMVMPVVIVLMFLVIGGVDGGSDGSISSDTMRTSVLCRPEAKYYSQ